MNDQIGFLISFEQVKTTNQEESETNTHEIFIFLSETL